VFDFDGYIYTLRQEHLYFLQASNVHWWGGHVLRRLFGVRLVWRSGFDDFSFALVCPHKFKGHHKTFGLFLKNIWPIL